MKEVYIQKLYGDLYKYCDGIIENALASRRNIVDLQKNKLKKENLGVL